MVIAPPNEVREMHCVLAGRVHLSLLCAFFSKSLLYAVIEYAGVSPKTEREFSLTIIGIETV